MWRNITTLLSGNAAAQLVNIATIVFVVARYISPEDFGRYAVLMSYIGILSVVACLRYDVALVSTHRDIFARNLGAAAILIAVGFTLLCAVVMWVIETIAGAAFLFGISLWLLLAALFLKALGQVFAGVLYRQERYLSYSVIRFVQALVLFGGFLWTGLQSNGVPGLMLSVFASYLTFAALASIAIGRQFFLDRVRLARMVAVARRETDFPLFNTPQALIDTFLSNGVNIVIMAQAGSTMAGYYSFMQRAVRAPLTLVFGAVSQVVFRFASRYREHSNRVRRELLRVAVFAYVLVAVGALCAAVVHANFGLLPFLENWSGLRDYLPAFSAWFLVPFLFSPFATLPIVYARQRTFFVCATSFNLMALASLGVFLALGLRQGAFLIVATGALVYFAGMSVWVYRLTAEAKT
ncbi:MAG: lipopolysaccharide biosynthesis protein [Gammaproteobacteria bacterium]